MRNLMILGAGGHGKVVADTAEQTKRWPNICFLDDCYPTLGRAYIWPVKGKFVDFTQFVNPETDFIVALGDNITRMLWCEKILQVGAALVSVLHPSAEISQHSQIGPGTVCFANSIVNINATIRTACIVNSGACVEHDCILEEAVHLCPNAVLAGNVKVGQYSTVGMNSCIKQGVTVGDNVTIGAGSVVINNIPSASTVFGIPAKVYLKK